jgi:hypothetical protein
MKNNRIILENQSEAQIFEGILQENDIPHVIVSFHDTAYDGLYQFQYGWGYAEIPEEYLAKAQELHEELKEEKNE